LSVINLFRTARPPNKIPRGNTIDNTQVIELIRTGHIDAYESLVRQYQKRVMGYCHSTLFNHRDAEEAAQDIFVKAYLCLNQFKGDCAFSTWLYRITANHCVDILRKRNRRKNVSLEALVEKAGDHIENFFVSSVRSDLRLENRQLADQILSTLSEEYRRVLILKEVLGLEYQEIAVVLNCTENSVKGRLARARKQLRENLPRFGERWHIRDIKQEALSWG
jgi:RNA polymerase sigma-70 factor (ECF subfamily)